MFEFLLYLFKIFTSCDILNIKIIIDLDKFFISFLEPGHHVGHFLTKNHQIYKTSFNTDSINYQADLLLIRINLHLDAKYLFLNFGL